MKHRRRRLAATFGVLVLSSMIASVGAAAAVEATPPSVRLFASSTSVTVERGRKDWVNLDPGTWLAAVGGTFELRASRADYDSPIVLTQTDAVTGTVLRPLPEHVVPAATERRRAGQLALPALLQRWVLHARDGVGRR